MVLNGGILISNLNSKIAFLQNSFSVSPFLEATCGEDSYFRSFSLGLRARLRRTRNFAVCTSGRLQLSEQNHPRTDQSFCVPKSDIVEQDYASDFG